MEINRKGKFKEILVIGIAFFAVSYLVIGFASSAIVFAIGVVLFFVGFNMHEPIMQSLASKFAKVHQRGLVLGIFNSALPDLNICFITSSPSFVFLNLAKFFLAVSCSLKF